MKNSLYVLWIVCLLVVGCGGGGEAVGEAEGSERREAGTGNQEPESGNLELRSIPYYRYLTGRIGDDLDIAMHLHVLSDSSITGHYWYQNVGRPIEFSLQDGKRGQQEVKLVEKDPDQPYDQSISGIFQGDFFYDGLIEGVWSNGDGSVALPFMLNDAMPEGRAEIELSNFDYAGKNCENPSDCVAIHIVELRAAGVPAAVAEKINEDLTKDYIRFVYSNPEQSPATTLQEAVDSLEIWMEKERAETGEDYLKNWAFQATPDVIYNQDNRLSFKIGYYSYSGGAHGNPFALCYNYDLKTGRKLEIADLFAPSQVISLKKEALRRIKLTYEGSLKDDLSDLGFLISDDEFELSKDFYYSPAGVGFVYSPYEIGPYVMGFVEVFVPFGKLGN